MKDVNDLVLHEAVTVHENDKGHIDVMRVPGGLLYVNYCYAWKTQAQTFVPFTGFTKVMIDYEKTQKFLDGER